MFFSIVKEVSLPLTIFSLKNIFFIEMQMSNITEEEHQKANDLDLERTSKDIIIDRIVNEMTEQQRHQVTT